MSPPGSQPGPTPYRLAFPYWYKITKDCGGVHRIRWAIGY